MSTSTYHATPFSCYCRKFKPLQMMQRPKWKRKVLFMKFNAMAPHKCFSNGEEASTARKPSERGNCDHSHTDGKFEGLAGGFGQGAAAGSAVEFWEG